MQGNGRTQIGGPRQIWERPLWWPRSRFRSSSWLGSAPWCDPLWSLRHQDFGFRGENVLMVELPWEFSPSMMARYQALREPLYDRMNHLPGVISAALSGFGPKGGDRTPARCRPPNARRDGKTTPASSTCPHSTSRRWESASWLDVGSRRRTRRARQKLRYSARPRRARCLAARTRWDAL